jgi:hypothetical protein
MKTCLTLFIYILALIPAKVFCQDSSKEDVVYMKSGAVFTGTATEQVAGESYRIERAGSSVLIVAACDVKKIKKGNTSISKYIHPKPCKEPFPYRNRGSFFQAQIPFGDQIIGIKAIAGYQFHRFAQIGISAGIEYASSISQKTTVLGAGYAPICFYYAGDVLKKEFTPFYSFEFGYAYSAPANRSYHSLPADYDYEHHTGGYTGGIGIGCKYHAWNSIFSCSWSVNFDFVKASLHSWGSDWSWGGGTATYSSTYSGTIYMIGTKFSIGL